MSLKSEYKKIIRFLNRKYLNLKIRNNEWAFISPYGIGDTLLLCMFAKSFKEKYGGKLHIFIKNSHFGLIEMFEDNIDKCTVLSKSKVDKLNYNINEAPLQKGKLYNAHPLSNKSSVDLVSYLGKNNINLVDLYKIFLGLNYNSALTKPKLQEKYKLSALEKFKKLNLKEGKTVIISPEANSMPLLNDGFWRSIIDICKSMDYDVFLNCILPNPFFSEEKQDNIDLGEICAFAELSGFAISLRSGLCDILAFSKCKVYTVYPDEEGYNKYSLINMFGENTNIEELIYDENLNNKILFNKIENWLN